MTLYGIRNCNTVKSSLAWLKNRKIDFEFHDYKSKGITEARLKDWCRQVGWESLVNKRGTTWRKLDERSKAAITNEKSAIALMMEKTSVIKRPLVEVEGKVTALGFDEREYHKRFS